MSRYCRRLSAACLLSLPLLACSPAEPSAEKSEVVVVPAAESPAPIPATDYDRLKLETVKSLYASFLNPDAGQAASEEPVVYQGSIDTALLSADLKRTLARDQRASQATGGIACIDYDPIVQGQDADPKEIASSLAFRLLDSGEVQVSFSNFGTANTLRYVLICRDQQCLIDDLIEDPDIADNQGSFKRRANACLDELAKEVSF